MSTGQIHVGDVGTKYRAKITDNGAAYDPSAAATKELLFKLPTGTVLTRTATVTHDDTYWYFEYVVLPADVVAGLHAAAGNYEWQGYLTFADGTTWHTTTEKYIVYPNLG